MPEKGERRGVFRLTFLVIVKDGRLTLSSPYSGSLFHVTIFLVNIIRRNRTQKQVTVAFLTKSNAVRCVVNKSPNG